MKLTFERATFGEIIADMRNVLASADVMAGAAMIKSTQENAIEPEGKVIPSPPMQQTEPQGPSPEEVEPVKGKPRAKSAKAKSAPAAEPADELLGEKALATPEAPLDPAELVRLRQSTIEELQAAFSNGKQKEVFELLKTHGNGAKSFRELTPDAFLPIRKAIDQGALA